MTTTDSGAPSEVELLVMENELLKFEVDFLKSRVEVVTRGFEDRVSALMGEVGAAKDRVSALTGELGAAKDRVAELEEKLGRATCDIRLILKRLTSFRLVKMYLKGRPYYQYLCSTYCR